MKRAVKITIWALCSLFILLFAACAALPTWLSTPSGTETALKWINAQIEGKLTVGKLDLNWLGSQRIENVTLVDGAGNLIFNLRFFETKSKLLYLALGGRSLSDTVVEDPYLYLSEETAEKLQKSKESKEGSKKRSSTWSYPTFAKSLYIHHGTMVFASKNLTPITIAEINVAKAAGGDNFHLEAQTTQGSQEGSITVDASFAKKIDAKVKLLNFPLATLDELQGSKLFTDAFGPTLSLEMNIEKEGHSSLAIHGTANSANLSAYIEGVTQDNKFSLSPQTRLDFTITPALFKTLINANERKEWSLASKTEVKIQVEKGVFPLTLSTPRFEDIVLQATISIDRAELHHQELSSYSLKNFSGSVIAQHNLEIAYSGEIVGKEQTKLSGTISITPEKEVLFQYAYDGFPVSLLSLVSPDLEKNVRALFGGQFDMESHGTYIGGNIDAHTAIKSSQTHLTAELKGELPDLNFEIAGSSQVPAEKAKIIGNALDFTLNGKLNLSDNQLSIPFVKGNISNPYLSFDVRGKVGNKGEPFTPKSIELIATGLLKQLPLGEQMPISALENTIVYIQVDGSKNQVMLKAEGQVLDTTVEIHHFIRDGSIAFDQAETTFSAELRQFPLEIVGPFISESFDLVPFLGERLNMSAQGSYTPLQEPRFSVSMNAHGSGFSASLAVALDKTLSVREDHPSYIYWEITPERYRALVQKMQLDHTKVPTFLLTKTAKLEIDIEQFFCPASFSQDFSHFLCQSGMTGTITLSPALFHSEYANESILFKEVRGSIKGDNFSEGIDLILGGDIVAANVPESEKSSFAFVESVDERVPFQQKGFHCQRSAQSRSLARPPSPRDGPA
ncbi:hypothetical protein ACFLR2_01660 [Chlamydiota bacterium]